MKSYDWKLESGPIRGDDGTRTAAVFYEDASDCRVEVGILTTRLSEFDEADTFATKEQRALKILRMMLDQYVGANDVQPGQLTRINENDVDLVSIRRAEKGKGAAGREGKDK
jgi:hypothetical protein